MLLESSESVSKTSEKFELDEVVEVVLVDVELPLEVEEAVLFLVDSLLHEMKIEMINERAKSDLAMGLFPLMLLTQCSSFVKFNMSLPQA